MRKTIFAVLAALYLIVLSTPSYAMNCVAYVRSVTGFDLSGDAWQWWGSADGVYGRGHAPVPGAVMVFSRTRGMRHGHVAVVRAVRGAREILIDQANWNQGRGPGRISTAVSVIDVSPDNDWTEVRVEWAESGNYGRVNPVEGFIYADGDSRAAVSSARFITAKAEDAEKPLHCATPRHRRGHRYALAASRLHRRHGDHRARLIEASWHPHGHGAKLHGVVAHNALPHHHKKVAIAAHASKHRHPTTSAS